VPAQISMAMTIGQCQAAANKGAHHLRGFALSEASRRGATGALPPGFGSLMNTPDTERGQGQQEAARPSRRVRLLPPNGNPALDHMQFQL